MTSLYARVSLIRHESLNALRIPAAEQRLQQLFYPEGVAFDGDRFNRTAATAPLFKYLEAIKDREESVVGADGIEPSTPRV